MRQLICGLMLLLLCGCNSVDQQAVHSFIKAGEASLQRSTSLKGSGLFPRKQMYWVVKIDDQPVKEVGHFRAYSLSPGMRSILAGGGLFQGHLGSHDTLSGEAELHLDAKAGHQYEVRGVVTGQELALYLFDLTANQVATKLAYPLTHAETHKDPIMIPIPVP